MTGQTPPVVWIDGDPLMEKIAAAVWEQCLHQGSIVVDDPRNIAAVVAAVLPPPADRAAVLREGAEAIDATFTGPDTDRYVRYGANLLRRMADEAVDTVTAEHHTVDGIRYLCHTDDHYCPPTDEAQPAQPQTGEADREITEYFVQSQQPDGSWEQASSTTTELDFAVRRLIARRRMQPDLVCRLARRTTPAQS
jgi:hypothetical protein